MSRGHGRQRWRNYASRQRDLRQRGGQPSIERVEWQLPEPPPAPRPARTAADGEHGLAHG